MSPVIPLGREVDLSVPAIYDSNDGHINTSTYLKKKTGPSCNLLAGRVQVHTFTFQTNTSFYIYTKSHTQPCVKHIYVQSYIQRYSISNSGGKVLVF